MTGRRDIVLATYVLPYHSRHAAIKYQPLFRRHRVFLRQDELTPAIISADFNAKRLQAPHAPR